MQTRINVSPIDCDNSQLESLEDLEIYSTEEYDPTAPEASENDSVYRIFSEGVEIIYKFVPNYPNYLISNYGQLINIKTEQQIGLGKNGRNYFKASLLNEFGRKNYYVHQLVALSFIGPCEKEFEIDHINHIRTDNRVSNLRYVSKSNNQKNRTIYNGHPAEYFDQLPTSCIQLKSYNQHQFDRYYIDVLTKQLYSFDNNQFRKLVLRKLKSNYKLRSILGKEVSVYLSKLLQNEYNK
ncbi:HNH_endonuclease [Hexamita inflata]|uniref:HNH endonuclease n=1 Tax=Hexamita inflata TaxID=28002 RepID=A0AA86QB40_9EUKA|nr:HNH endonuclease [Hexamita inflata]